MWLRLMLSSFKVSFTVNARGSNPDELDFFSGAQSDMYASSSRLMRPVKEKLKQPHKASGLFHPLFKFLGQTL